MPSSARAGRVRAATVGQIGRAGGTGTARVARSGGGVLDQADLLGDDFRRSRELGPCSCSIRSGWPASTPDVVVAAGASSWDGALEVAWRLAAAGELDQRGVEGGDFWAVAAEQRLAPLLYTAAGTGAGIDSVVRWAYGQGARELHEALARTDGHNPRRVALEGPTPHTTRCARLKPRPTGPEARSRRPRRRCCAPTGSAG